MRVRPRILIQRLRRRLGTRKAILMMPWLVLALGLITTAGISEQTRRFGIQEHQRIESTLLDNLIDTLRSKLEIDITMLTAVVGFLMHPLR